MTDGKKLLVAIMGNVILPDRTGNYYFCVRCRTMTCDHVTKGWGKARNWCAYEVN